MNHAQAERAMSAEQRKMIFALYRECGIGKELRHDVQHGVAGKTSLTDFTSHDAARLIEHLERLQVRQVSACPRAAAARPEASPNLTPRQAGAGLTSRAPAPTNPPASPFSKGGKSRGAHDYYDTMVHKLPSPEQLTVLDHLYTFAGYTSEDTRRTFADRIEKHSRPRSMWEAEELIFALVAQAAPKMLAAITAPGFSARLTPFELAFMFTNRVKFDLRGTMIPCTFNNAKIELEEYIAKRNKRGHRTMPRFSLSKFFEIVGKYR